ncbi:MAG: YraN family protein [Alphaproteobacteria bacterium]|nr:YraN family protein [Alphaproteobacteria bacterium]
MRSNSYKKGLFAEFLARNYLRFHGFKILESRYITGRNTNRAEIDIIARRKNLIVFIEVKNRSSVEGAFGAISATQAMRLRRAAETYLARINWMGDARFDVIAVCGHRIHWIKNSI